MSGTSSLFDDRHAYMRERAEKFRAECRKGSAAWLLAGDVLVLLRQFDRILAPPRPFHEYLDEDDIAVMNMNRDD